MLRGCSEVSSEQKFSYQKRSTGNNLALHRCNAQELSRGDRYYNNARTVGESSEVDDQYRDTRVVGEAVVGGGPYKLLSYSPDPPKT